MNETQLRLQLASAVERHARTLQDHGGRAGPVLIEDLERVAVKHAADMVASALAHQRSMTTAQAAVPLPAAASERVTADPSLASASLVAADLTEAVKAVQSPGSGSSITAVPPSPSTVRTRTRTRGGPK